MVQLLRAELTVPLGVWTEFPDAGGVALGTAVGVALGTAVGVALGTAVGVALGVAVGVPVGAALGVTVGVAVGVALGPAVGVALGVALVVAVGVVVGVTEGVAVGPAWATADQTVTASATITGDITTERQMDAFGTVLLLMATTHNKTPQCNPRRIPRSISLSRGVGNRHRGCGTRNLDSLQLRCRYTRIWAGRESR